MARGPHLTEAEVAEIWLRRGRGQPVWMIARELGRARTTVHRAVASNGGLPPRQPRRSRRELSTQEREEISRGLAAGLSCRAIAHRLRKAASSISREVARNGGREDYRAAVAEAAAVVRRRRPKPCKLGLSAALRETVEGLLKQHWSPQQISAWLKREHPKSTHMNVSHETIYVSLYLQSRGALRKELAQHLRRGRTYRRARNELRPVGPRKIPNPILISERPAEVADRAVPGHWEGDLLLGKPTDGIGTLVERSTRYVMLFTLPPGGIRAESVREQLATTIGKLPASLWRTLTWDQGSEMAQHARFTVDSGVAVYFCDPGKPWQRGTNENTNGLLRQYFPKGHSLRDVSQARLDDVADELNRRPRETLGWRTPAEALAQLLSDSTPVGGASTP